MNSATTPPPRQTTNPIHQTTAAQRRASPTLKRRHRSEKVKHLFRSRSKARPNSSDELIEMTAPARAGRQRLP